jgi:hypothetical protein
MIVSLLTQEAGMTERYAEVERRIHLGEAG